ncbi:MAG: glycoside hydrolase family 20 protein [Bacteroidota bacterium]
MKKGILLFATIVMAVTVHGNNQSPIIPEPVEISLKEGHFTIDEETSVHFNAEVERLASLADYFRNYIKEISGHDLALNKSSSKEIRFELIDHGQLGKEGYQLDVTQEGIAIQANDPQGIFYGMQSLFQTLTPIRTNEALNVPAMEVLDYPRFEWRGMMLDVSRHFFSPEAVKQFIDLMATYKMNKFHWHLVDDPGWRIEIKKYPKLTEVGAWRVDYTDMPWSERPPAQGGDTATYGGYYTQEQIKEIVAYAQERNITIVPEIELPGHSVAALAAYPQYSCTGEPQFVITGGDYPEDVQTAYCPGKEKTFTFLQNILIEVMDLFPSEYIHVGGDEVDKSQWEKCDLCQERIEEEGLDDEDGLQSYMIRRMEKFLSNHGRKLIGWDEILEGGLAPGATVMSWRGESGGIKAARMDHDVVMTPGSPCYFDHYQAGPEGEPLAFGGMNTLKDVYDYDPIPSQLEEEKAKHVLGAQGNVWTEYIPTLSHLEYMILPRMTALSEVVWSPAGKKDWEAYNRRLRSWHFRMYDHKGFNYSEGNSKVIIKPVSEEGRLMVELRTELIDAGIVYTLDGSEPTSESKHYTEPIEIEQSTTLKASTVRNGEVLSPAPAVQEFSIHKAIGREVEYENPVSSYYSADGPNSLTDGVRGTLEVGKFWHGFSGSDMVAEIDLGREHDLNELVLGALQKRKDWIFPPRQVIFEVSDNGDDFREVATVDCPLSPDDKSNQIIDYRANVDVEGARYIRVKAKNFGVCPEGHPGEGEPTWLFVDEIIVK